MIRFKHKGDFSKTERYLKRVKAAARLKILKEYGQRGVDALAAATPKDTGLTASSWRYEIVEKQGASSLEFHNSNVKNGVLIAIIIQHGHVTGTGGWVQGRDYINPALQPIFDELANKAWREVTKI